MVVGLSLLLADPAATDWSFGGCRRFSEEERGDHRVKPEHQEEERKGKAGPFPGLRHQLDRLDHQHQSRVGALRGRLRRVDNDVVVVLSSISAYLLELSDSCPIGSTLQSLSSTAYYCVGNYLVITRLSGVHCGADCGHSSKDHSQAEKEHRASLVLRRVPLQEAVFNVLGRPAIKSVQVVDAQLSPHSIG